MGLIVYRDRSSVIVCDQCGEEIRDANLIDLDGWVIHEGCIEAALRNIKFAYEFTQIIREHAEKDTEGWREACQDRSY